MISLAPLRSPRSTHKRNDLIRNPRSWINKLMILSSINKLMIFIISRRRESGSRRIEDPRSSLRMASKLVREEEVIREWEKRRQNSHFSWGVSTLSSEPSIPGWTWEKNIYRDDRHLCTLSEKSCKIHDKKDWQCCTRVPTIEDCLAMPLDLCSFGFVFSSPSRAVGSMASTRLVLLSYFPPTISEIFIIIASQPPSRKISIIIASQRPF